jgi:hypothetical protein
MEFPKIKEGKEAEFKQWFAESNKVYTRFDGFVSRRNHKSFYPGNAIAPSAGVY